MIKKRYPLKCHNQEKNDIEVHTTIELQHNKFKIEYEITADLSPYNFPKKSKQQRADELWRDTCFELFITNRSSDEYYEINTSPSTKWNAYHFQNYKEDMSESDVFSVPSIISQKLDNRYSFSFEMAFQEDIFEKELLVNLAIILLDRDCVRHFYSIHRREGSPDFHDRDGFKSFEQTIQTHLP